MFISNYQEFQAHENSLGAYVSVTEVQKIVGLRLESWDCQDKPDYTPSSLQRSSMMFSMLYMAQKYMGIS